MDMSMTIIVVLHYPSIPNFRQDAHRRLQDPSDRKLPPVPPQLTYPLIKTVKAWVTAVCPIGGIDILRMQHTGIQRKPLEMWRPGRLNPGNAILVVTLVLAR